MATIIHIGTLLLNFLYTILKLLPQRKKAIILSRQSNTPSLDISMLEERIKRTHGDYTVIVMCKKIDSGLLNKVSYCLHMLKQMYHLATTEIVILDSYCILVSLLKHRKNIFIVQMWHSIGTMKKFGYSILDKPEGSSSKIAGLMKMHKNYDYILAAGDGYKSHLADGFNYPIEKVVTLPLPRVEALKDKEFGMNVRNMILSMYPQLQKKKNILYVPTFRKTDDSELLNALSQLCNSIDYNKYNLIVKVHPLTSLNGFEHNSALIDNEFSSFQMLFISDIVISDYSCIMYEAAVLNKPVYLYTYDYDNYMSTRDIYMDYKTEVPGPVCYDSSSLMNCIDNSEYNFDKLQHFLNKYVYMGSSSETDDIVQFIFNRK